MSEQSRHSDLKQAKTPSLQPGSLNSSDHAQELGLSARKPQSSSHLTESQKHAFGMESQKSQDFDKISYHSMTLSQRVTYNNAKMMAESELPEINQERFRIQSATQRSQSSARASSRFSEHKGPIKAFEELNPSKFKKKETPLKEDQSTDRFDSIQILDASSIKQRKGTLEPIQTGSIKSSQKKLSSRVSQQDVRRSQSSSKLSKRSRRDAKSDTDANFVGEKKIIPDSQNHANTTFSSPTQIKDEVEAPFINLDLHQVALAGDAQESAAATSAHDQEATIIQNRNQIKKTQQVTAHTVGQSSSVSHHNASKIKKPKRVNQFKSKKMSHEEIISFLFDLSSQSVGLNRKLEPTDLNSTSGLDSFLSAVIYINEHNVQKKDQKLIENLHLSTGTRTNFCLEVLNFIIKQQAKETIFIDAVEFFQESLEHLVEVENENMKNKQLVEELQLAKTELTMMRFDLQNKLRETSNALLKLRQKSYEQSLTFSDIKNQLEAKRAECESLHYRLKIVGLGPVESGQQQPNGTANVSGLEGQISGLAQSFIQSAEGGLAHALSSQKASISHARMSDLTGSHDTSPNKPELDDVVKQIQEGLENQVQQFRQFKSKGNYGNEPEDGPLQRLQDMLNQSQIDNKNLTEENNALKTRIEAKERLVAHLENKVTHIMIENEETILKLKTEVVLLKNSIDTNDGVTSKKLLEMRERVENENKIANGQKIADLTSQSEKLLRENQLQKNRIDQLSKDYSDLHSDFEKYRADKNDQETQRDIYVSEVEKKLASLSKNHVNSKNSLSKQIKTLENSIEQKTKENQILYLRLRYMRQTADVLLRQKNFLFDTLIRSKQELDAKMNQLESSMLSQNKNKSYLVSVEKAVKQSRNVAEISKTAMQNVLQIVKFFKVEKIHQLLFQTEQPTVDEGNKSEDGSAGALSSRGPNTVKPFSDEGNEDENAAGPNDFHLQKISGMLNDLKSCLDLPVNFKPRISLEAQKQQVGRMPLSNQKALRNEEYFLEHCQVELVSALLKVIVEILIRVKVVGSVEQIPFSISRLLYLASNRSDQPTEREIFEQFCLDSNKILIQEINHYQDKVIIFEQMQTLIPSLDQLVGLARGGETVNVRISDVEQQQEEQKLPTSAQISSPPLSDAINHKKPLTMMQQSAMLYQQQSKGQTARKKEPSKIIVKQKSDNTANRAKESSPNRRERSLDQNTITSQDLSKKQMKTELELLVIAFAEQKETNQITQKILAEKVIKLEETIDFIKEDYDDKIDQAEFSYRQELEQIRLGTIQREKQLLYQIDLLQDRNANLELSSMQQNVDQNRAATPGHKNSQTGIGLKKNSVMSSTGIDGLRQAASVQSLVQEIDSKNQENLQAIERQFETYKSNVKEFVRIRESTHGTISLVFEAQQTNITMINDSVLSFYLSRIFKMPKEKFRLLRTYTFFEEKRHLDMQRQKEVQLSVHSQELPIEMIKIVIEIIEDQNCIKHDLLEFKTAIRDGSSLLYDLLPSYLCINMGHSGLATKNEISNCHLVSKQGKQINGVNFLVNLMRSIANPYCFMVVLLNFETGEEYCLELDDQDVLSLTEGDRGLLEDSEPMDLQNAIVDNLELIERDGIKFLTCTQKVFFNHLWHGIMSSKLSQTSQHQQPTKLQKEHDLRIRSDIEENQINAQFTKTTIRDDTLLQSQPFNRLNVSGHYKKLLMKDSSCQTDYQGNLLYDSIVTVYKGHIWLNSEVKIDLEVQQSQNENIATIIFREPRFQNTAKFCVFNRVNHSNTNFTSMAKTETDDGISNGVEQFESRVSVAGNGSQPKSQYIIHSEVIIVGKDHLVMVCVERIQNDGFLVKLHDLKMITSDEFYLVRKSNGHLTRLNLSQNLQLMYQEEFRNLIFDLAFAQQTQSQDLMLQNLTYASEKLQAIGKNPNFLTKEMYLMAGGAPPQGVVQPLSTGVRALKDFQAEAILKAKKSQQTVDKTIEWRSLQEKGLLLYRDVRIVRTNFNSVAGPAIEGVEEELESLISFYLKDDLINIEVFLFNDEDKMSINTNVQALELFGRQPGDIPFNERVNLLDSMLEKLFVLQQEGKFHMKVENQAMSITQMIKERSENKQAIDELNKSTSALKRRQFSDQIYEEKIREIQMEKTAFVKSGKARLFQRYVTQSGLSFTISIYVILKQKKAQQKQSNKRLNTVGKTQQQIEAQKIEIFLEEYGEFDMVYIETNHPVTDDIIFMLIDRRKMAKILTKDVTCDWRQLISMWWQDLTDYIFRNIILDLDLKKIEIYNSDAITELLVASCRAVSGGQLLKKDNNLIVDGFGEESAKLLNKTLVLNEEIDFTEISYDIKLFKISRKSPFGDGNLQIGAETLSYHIEIFNLNQPDIVYKHRIPCQQTSTSSVHDPVSFIIDVFNLIDNPLIDDLVKSKEKQKSKDSPQRSPSRKKSNKNFAKPEKKQKQAMQGDHSQSSSQMKSPKNSAAHEVEAENSEEKLKAAEDEKNQHEKVLKEHSTKYQLLFKKYIDNQLILVIQESKFPASISFTLVEPSTRLLWKSTYEPKTEIVSPSSFSVVDMGAFETFMTVVYNALVPQAQSIITPGGKSAKMKGDWHNIQPKDSDILDEVIDQTLHISIKKDVGKLRILLQNPVQIVAAEQDGKITEVTKELIELFVGKNDFKQNGLDLVIQKNRGVYYHAKVLNLDDCNLERTVQSSFVLIVNCSVKKFHITIVKLNTQQCIFNFKFKHTNPAEQDIFMTPITEVNPLLELSDVKQHVLDAVRNLNSEHLQEQIQSNHISIQQEKMLKKAGVLVEDEDSRITTFENVLFKVNECPAHQQRFYQRKMDQVKIVTLHRKIYYDETMEKLIIITANIKYRQGMQRLDNPMLLNEEINVIDFKILEPEHNTLTCLTVPLDQCFNERQLMALNKRDMLRLKSLVRIVLEERSEIRRKELDQNEQNHAYTLIILPQPSDQFIDEIPNVDQVPHLDHRIISEQQQIYLEQQEMSIPESQINMGSMDDMEDGDDNLDQMSGNRDGQMRGQDQADHYNQFDELEDRMQQNDGSGQNSNQQRGQQNSVIIEELSQEEKDLEGEYARTPGGSILYRESQKSSSRDVITHLKQSKSSFKSMPSNLNVSRPSSDVEPHSPSYHQKQSSSLKEL